MTTETKKYWRTIAILAVLAVLAIIPLVWQASRMSEDSRRRRIIAANEAGALAALQSIAAAQQLYLQSFSRYGTFRELVEAGVFQAPLTGDSLVSHGYTFTMRVTPRSETQAASFNVNADPQSREGENATGRRHYYLDSNLVGIRVNEERPAGPNDRPRTTVSEY